MLRAPTSLLRAVLCALALLHAVHGSELKVSFVQQPKPDSQGLFAPVVKVEPANPAVPVNLDGASVLLQLGTGSPPAVGLDGPMKVPIEAGYANFSAAFRRLGIRGGYHPGKYTLEAFVLGRNKPHDELVLRPRPPTLHLELFQEIETRAAHDMVAFTAGGRHFLGVANLEDGGRTNITSDIYVLNSAQTRFNLFQQINTFGAMGIAAFADFGGNRTYLTIANFWDTSRTHEHKSFIYVLNAAQTKFDLFDTIYSEGGNAVEFFEAGGRLFLASTNAWRKTSLDAWRRSIERGDGGQFAHMREEGLELHVLDAAQTQFNHVQGLETFDGRGMSAFAVGDYTFLGVAQHRHFYGYGHGPRISKVYEMNTAQTRFSEEIFQQDFENHGGDSDMASFQAGDRTFLGVAYRGKYGANEGKSQIYVMNATQTKFKIFQQINTVGASSMQFAAVGGMTILAVANGNNGSTKTLTSDIYVLNTTQDKFELFRRIVTQGAEGIATLKMNRKRTFWGFANSGNGSTTNVKSAIYMLSELTGASMVVPAATSAPFELRAAGTAARLESRWVASNRRKPVSNMALAPAMAVSVVDQLGNTVPCAGDIAAIELQPTSGVGQLCRRPTILPQVASHFHAVPLPRSLHQALQPSLTLPSAPTVFTRLALARSWQI